jgi:PAS domain S-box-containing protein
MSASSPRFNRDRAPLVLQSACGLPTRVIPVIDVSRLYIDIDHPRFRPGSGRAFLVTALIVAMATAVRVLLNPWMVAAPFVAFFPAVIVATFLAGSGAGCLAALLSILATWLLISPAEISALALYQMTIFGTGSLTVVALIGAMRAATANVRRLNETLRLSEGKFRGLLESAPDAMVIIDEQHRIALINAQTEAVFGYGRAELLGQPIVMLMAERDRGAYPAALAAVLRGPATALSERVIDLHGLRKDGAEFPIEVSLGPLETEAGTLVSNAIRDISAHQRIEASLEAASTAKSNFLASVSHELRTPLNAIIGFSEMIRDAVIGPLDARYRGYGADINDSGRHLQNIINDILDISKIEGGRLELRDEIVSISECAEACRRIVASMAETAGVALAIELPAVLPLIRSDQLRFQQILLNLMSNAVKFTPTGGRVRVSAAIEAEGAIISVEDTGIGMKKADIAIALEPFRQIEGPLSRRFDGTGLGLPLAKALVELHGGRLDIQSAPAAGTTVRIRLPAERILDAAA